jgi:long-subunit acyl-CoA synthetase (AMP-forming)
MTEVGLCTAMCIRDPSKLNRASFPIGKTLPYLEFKVVNEDGHILPLNTTGMLYVRGFSVFKEYYEDVEKTNEIKDEEGW